MTTNIKFTRMSGPYRTGDVAGFPDEHAAKIVAGGAAVVIAERPHPDVDPERGDVERINVDAVVPAASASAQPLDPPGKQTLGVARRRLTEQMERTE